MKKSTIATNVMLFILSLVALRVMPVVALAGFVVFAVNMYQHFSTRKTTAADLAGPASN